MKEQWYTARRWYRITAPDGYECLEQASSPSEAKARASQRPGYQPVEALRAQVYEAERREGNWKALGENVRRMREKIC